MRKRATSTESVFSSSFDIIKMIKKYFLSIFLVLPFYFVAHKRIHHGRKQ